MKIPTIQTGYRRDAAFTLAEVVIATAVLGIMMVAFFAALSDGFGVVRLMQEELRATQVLQEKTEIMRLYSWDQLTTSGYVPTNFTAPFYASGSNNGGLTYTGTVSITDANISEAYASNLKLVQIQVNWTSGKVPRQRSMSTWVSRYGLQNYIK